MFPAFGSSVRHRQPCQLIGPSCMQMGYCRTRRDTQATGMARWLLGFMAHRELLAIVSLNGGILLANLFKVLEVPFLCKFSTRFCLQRRHVRCTNFGTGGFANSIWRSLETQCQPNSEHLTPC